MTLSYTICINLHMPASFHLIIIREESEAIIKVVVPDRWEVKCYFLTESGAETGNLRAEVSSRFRYAPCCSLCLHVMLVGSFFICPVLRSQHGTLLCKGT